MERSMIMFIHSKTVANDYFSIDISDIKDYNELIRHYSERILY